MKKTILLLTFSMGTMLWADMPDKHHADIKQYFKNNIHKTMSENHQNARKRTFRTAKEFKHHKRKYKQMKHMKSVVRGAHYRTNRYINQRYRYDSYSARGYRYYKNSWYEAYRYDRASFSDGHGYYYGYFDRRGYMFEGEFYRYDRFYTYRDRMRGKELFGHRYYRPIVNYNDGYDNRY